MYAEYATMGRTRYTSYLDDDLRVMLAAVKVRDGISESEQIRRALRLWFDSKGVAVKAGRKRVSPRKRP
jgi:hypothetical protein